MRERLFAVSENPEQEIDWKDFLTPEAANTRNQLLNKYFGALLDKGYEVVADIDLQYVTDLPLPMRVEQKRKEMERIILDAQLEDAINNRSVRDFKKAEGAVLPRDGWQERRVITPHDLHYKRSGATILARSISKPSR